jgi:hypothetical protein
MSDFDAVLQAIHKRITSLAQQACDDLADAWAHEISKTAPVKTGLLSQTASAENSDLKLQFYWSFVAYGHRIVSPKTKQGTVTGVDAMGNEVFRMTKPNPYMEKAWESDAVQRVLDHYGNHGIHIPYPLKKVG